MYLLYTSGTWPGCTASHPPRAESPDKGVLEGRRGHCHHLLSRETAAGGRGQQQQDGVAPCGHDQSLGEMPPHHGRCRHSQGGAQTETCSQDVGRGLSDFRAQESSRFKFEPLQTVPRSCRESDPRSYTMSIYRRTKIKNSVRTVSPSNREEPQQVYNKSDRK